MTQGRIIVVTSCTARKVASNGRAVTAESLYSGQQHVRLMRGVRSYRRARRRPDGPKMRLTLQIVSAGKGLLSWRQRVNGYNQTFHGQPRVAIRRRANKLAVPTQLRELLGEPYELALLLLGDDYLEACQFDEDLALGGTTLAFCGPAVARRLPSVEPLRAVELGNAEAQRFSCGLIALKGELGGRILTALAEGRGEAMDILRDPRQDLLSWLDRRPHTGVGLVEAT